MVKIKYSLELMNFISLFESVTRARVKDCFFDNYGQLFFIVAQGEIGKAIGKKGSNVKKMDTMLGRRFRIVEFSDDMEGFMKNLVYPIELKEVEESDGIVNIKGLDRKTKGLLIGRNAMTIKNYENIVKRYFKIGGLKVV